MAPPSIPVPDHWRRRLLASFGVPSYRWFFVGQGTSFLGSWVRSAAQGWLVYLLTDSPRALGLVTALTQVPLFLAPVAGSLADRVDKRRLLAVLALLAMSVSLSLAALTWTGEVRPGHVMVLATLSGLVFAFEIPTRQSFVVEIVGKEHLGNAIALNSALFHSARFAGPAVAGLLMAAWPGEGREATLRGISVCFLVDGVSFLAVLFALTRIRPVRAAAPPKGGMRESLLAGFAYVRGNRRAKVLLTLLSICMVFGASYLALMPAFARDVLDLRERGYGLLVSCNGAGAALGALWVAGRAEAPTRLALRRRVFGSLGLFAASVVVFSRMRDPRLACIPLVLAGFGAISFVSTSNTLIQAAVPDDLRGRVMGIWTLVFGSSMPLGSWLLGHLAEAAGVPLAITISGSLCLALSGLVWLLLPPSAAPSAPVPPPSPDSAAAPDAP